MGRLFAEKLGEPFSASTRASRPSPAATSATNICRPAWAFPGCNFAVADTGTLVIVENEGNAGLSTATPPVHVALVGIEKVLPRIDYLPLFLNLLARSGTGQKLTTYTHLIHGPTAGQKLYVIFLDNGRTQRAGRPGAPGSRCIASAAGPA